MVNVTGRQVMRYISIGMRSIIYRGKEEEHTNPLRFG